MLEFSIVTMFEIDFIVGQDNFADVSLVPTTDHHFYFFYNQVKKKRIRRFVLDATKPRVVYACIVTFTKKGERGTPRLHFITKDLTGRYAKVRAPKNEATIDLKASVNLSDCHENFWKLIAFLRTFREIEIPDEVFSLVSKDDAVIVAGIRERDVHSVKSIVRQLLDGVNLSVSEVNVLLRRKEHLAKFGSALNEEHPEHWWQDFFDQNKWIFGYGLNYVILRVEEQPYVGAKRFDRTGGQNPDFIGVTSGAVRFTVLVEIKTPQAPLLSGEEEIRNGAWSLSSELTDALVQIQANVDKWNEASKSVENIDALERRDIYTVTPKGILVVGNLAEVKGSDRSRHRTFERFRQSVRGIEIITFDELYERAKFIVDHTE